MAGRQLGNYRIIDYVGSGGFGSVFKAEDVKQPGRIVAIKELHRKHTRSSAIKQRFFQEAVAMARLDHPNLPRLYTFGEDNGSYFLVMEFVSGTLLADELEKGVVPIPRAIEITTQVLAAVSYAHKNGIIHRDLKPDNIMIVENSESLTVKVLDFGIARLVSENLTMTGEGFGTPNYMSPERLSGSAVIDQSTDIYSAGIILFEMLTGKPPFESKSSDPGMFWAEIRRLHESASLPPLAPFGVPDNIESVIRKAAAKRPEDRFATADEMLAALRGETLDARILLSTAPPAADVYIDDILRGRSDDATGKLLVESLTPGLHSVKISKQGYNTYKLDIALEAGAETSLQVPLAARATVAVAPETERIQGAHDVKTAELVVEHLPPNSVISIGNNTLGQAGDDGRATVKLGAGTYEILVTSPGGLARTQLVTVNDRDLGLQRAITIPAKPAGAATVIARPAGSEHRGKKRLASAVAAVILISLAVIAYFVLRGPSRESLGVSQQAQAVAPSPTLSDAETNSNAQPKSPETTPAIKPERSPANEATKVEPRVVETSPAPEPAQPVAQPSPPVKDEEPVARGDACLVILVVGPDNQPVAGQRVGYMELSAGSPAVMRQGRTGPNGRWRACGLTPGSRLKASALGPVNRVLTVTEIMVAAGGNHVVLRLNRELPNREPLMPRRRLPGFKR